METNDSDKPSTPKDSANFLLLGTILFLAEYQNGGELF